MTKCSSIEPSWSPTRRIRSGWNKLHCVDGSKNSLWFGHYPRIPSPHLIQKGFHVGDFRKTKKFDQTPYKLPPPTPIHVPAEKRLLEEKSLPFS
ncbi:hypothetical protein TNCV_991211 [Trichonephila clavipes]|nr:hypothetical protein TNCV_991211 [Trichonephila clavipes]